MRASIDTCVATPSSSRACGASVVANSCRRRRAVKSLPRAKTRDEDAPWGPHAPPLEPHTRRIPLFTYHEARRCLDARERGDTEVELSLDFHLTPRRPARADADGVRTTTAEGHDVFASWASLEDVADDERGVFEPENEDDWTAGGLRKVSTFSDDTGRAVSLMPSGENTWPTALIAGFSMHRFGVGVDPEEDTRKKLGAVAPIRRDARLLDICTGLAYTSCMAAVENGARVTTIELDRSMTEMCRMNPHSRALFDGSIQQLYGNGADVVKTFADATFDVIITDPPTFALAGELYSAEFYADLKRILRPKGRIYHYIGDPKSSSGSSVAAGVVRRLKSVGLDAAIDYDAHGVVAARDRVRLNRSKTPPSAKSKPSGKKTNARPRRRDRRDDDDDDEDAR